MRNYFDMQMKTLHQELKEMGGLCQLTISKTYQLLHNGDVEVIKSIVAQEDQINQKERDIESLCLKLLLRQQPVASDLRKISAALKMITDMERIGDHAADISEISIHLSKEAYISHLGHIEQMAKLTSVMVLDCMQAFVDRDMEKAKEIIKRDDQVDGLFLQVRNDLIDLIRQDSKNASQAADLLMVAKYFERIGDHATNIAEWVMFSITGSHKSADAVNAAVIQSR